MDITLRENVTKGPLSIGTHKMALLYALSASIRREKKKKSIMVQANLSPLTYDANVTCRGINL